MQRKYGLLVLVLALALVFSFGALAVADEVDGDTPADEVTTNEETGNEEGNTEGDATEGEGDATEGEATDDNGEADPADPADAVTPSFADVAADYWAVEYIEDIFARKITTGVDETNFGPEQTLTRAQFVTFLGRLAGVDAAAYTESPFTDISEDIYAYAHGYICWAADLGITKGVSETAFGPANELNREQMATFVVRFAAIYGITLENGVAINDAASVSQYAIDEKAIEMTAGTLISIDADGNFAPLASATRAQMAEVLSKFPVPADGFVVAGDEPAEGDADEELVPEEEPPVGEPQDDANTDDADKEDDTKADDTKEDDTKEDDTKADDTSDDTQED